MYQDKEEIIVPQTVLMEVSFRGIHIIDKRRKDVSPPLHFVSLFTVFILNF